MSETNANLSKPSKTILDKISELFSNAPKDRSQITAILQTAHEKGILDSEAMSIIQGGMHVSEMHVREIMVPRSQMVVVKTTTQLKEILPALIESQHSRFPVIGDNLDDVVGILLAKDLLPFIADDKVSRINLKEIIRPATFVPESKRLNVLLREFRSNRNHMALVVDEYGSTCGLVTIEDVLEQIVGEIEDEHDFEEDHYIKPGKGERHIVKAITPISTFNEHFGTQFSEDEFDTVGGYVTHAFGHLPKRHETLELGNLSISILNADNRTVKLIQVSPITHRANLASVQ